MSESAFALVRSFLFGKGEGKKKKMIWVPGLIFLVLSVLFLSLSTCQEEKELSTIHSEDAMALSQWRILEEEKLAELICHLEGVEKCYISIHFSRGEESVREGGVTVSFSPPRVSSVVVLYEGRKTVYLKEKIVDMVTTLYDIGSNRVSVSDVS